MKKTSNMAVAPTKFYTPPVDQDIPMPPIERRLRSKNSGAQIRWPFGSMNIGDSLLVPNWAEPSRATAYIVKAKREKQLPETFKIVVRKTGQGYRVWRAA